MNPPSSVALGFFYDGTATMFRSRLFHPLDHIKQRYFQSPAAFCLASGIAERIVLG